MDSILELQELKNQKLQIEIEQALICEMITDFADFLKVMIMLKKVVILDNETLDVVTLYLSIFDELKQDEREDI